jgi:HAD superfamily hydrolase (TIGR01509 family)
VPADLNVRAGERQARPKAVIFDIGRVIVRLDLNRAFAPIAAGIRDNDGSAKRLSPEEVWKIICQDERWPDWQEGRLSPRDWHEHLMRRLKLSLTYAQFREAWNLVLDPETILSDELFAELSGRCRLALLSNTDPLHVEELEERFTFARHFPVRIYSCSVGASKPSPAIYRAALERLGISASEALYVDDIQEFVDAARGLGMDAIRFESRSGLEEQLRMRDLLGSTGR